MRTKGRISCFAVFGISTILATIAEPALCQPDKKNWLQFRGPGGQGIAAGDRAPVTWGPEKNVLWKKDFPGSGVSSPIIIGNRLFLTSYSGYGEPRQTGQDIKDLRLHVLCLSRSNGKLLWRKDIKPKLPESTRIREEHGYASSTPIADSERVYVFFGKSGVYAFDHDGNQQWRANAGSKVSGWGSAASPILHRNLLIVNASVESGSLIAFDKRTGKEKWRAGGIREAWNRPVLAKTPGGKTELIVAIVRKVLSFDPETGKQLWWCDTGINWYMVPGVVVSDGIVYCIGGRTGGSLAVRTGGPGDVTQTARIWKGRKGSNVSSPVLHGGHLYWMHEKLGIAYCANAKTGKIVYEERIPRAGQVYAASLLAGDKLYYVSRSGRTFVVAAQPSFKLLAVNELGRRDRFDASPAVVDGRLYLRSHKFLYCIGEK